MVAASVIGVALGHSIPPVLQVGVAIIIIASLALISTELMNFPHPYDKALSPSAGNANVFNEDYGKGEPGFFCEKNPDGTNPARAGEGFAISSGREL